MDIKIPMVAILVLDKIIFKMKAITGDKEGHYIILQGTVQQKGIIFLNIYTPHIGAPKHIRQILETLRD